GLHVEQKPHLVLRLAGGISLQLPVLELRHVQIVDLANDAVRGAPALGVQITDGIRADLDLDAEVDTALPDEVTEVFQAECAVLTCVAQDHVAAAAPDQLVDATILEMPTVRDVDVLLLVVGQPEQLDGRVADTERRPGAVPAREPGALRQPPSPSDSGGEPTARPPWIRQPPSEPGVEHCHQERRS